MKNLSFIFAVIISTALLYQCRSSERVNEKIRVIAFFTARHDPAHISFVHEANKWFDSVSYKQKFTYDSTSDWSRLNSSTLNDYDLVIFLDTRPDSLSQREAFENYIENGGAWLGFHFSAFALTPSTYPQNWNWYHQNFLGSGQYNGNTWKPTSANLKIEESNHPVTKGLPSRITASPNEWYKWTNDLTKNPDIQILVSIDSSSFPLGTGPKPHEIWHTGYFPVVWTNIKYKMVYMNMGHNDMDYDGGTNMRLSSSFSSEMQNQLIINAIKWLGNKE